MASPSWTTTQEVPSQCVPFVFPLSEGIGPPFIATLNLLGLTIGLPIWLFNPVILVTPNVSNVTSPLREDRLNLIPLLLRRLLLHPFLLLHLTKALWLVVMWIRKRRKGRVRRRRIRKRKRNNYLPLMVLILRESLENPSSLVSFARGTTFLRSVLVSPLYKKSGLKGPKCLFHQPLVIMLMILPQPVTHW